MEWIATCPHETLDVLAIELNALGIKNLEKLYRGIIFDCDLETAYRAHLCLRTASRIQRVVAKFDSPNLKTFQNELNKIVWPDWLRSHRPLMVRATLADREPTEISEDEIVASVVHSVQHSTFEKGAPQFNPEAENPITIVVFIRNSSCVIGLDTAGRALHKRGWRANGHPAVLKETLAASILMLAGYTGEEPLLDPMCGSGTLVVEAAYIALNKAPLIHRGKDDFALEHLAGFDRPLWRKISDQLRAQKKAELQAPIFARDIQSKYVDVARSSALRGRVEKYINFGTSAFQDLTPPADHGLIVANLPYGERIGSGVINQLYSDVGKTLKDHYKGWRVALLAPNESPIHLLGLSNAKKISLLNGALPVKLLLDQI